MLNENSVKQQYSKKISLPGYVNYPNNKELKYV